MTPDTVLSSPLMQYGSWGALVCFIILFVFLQRERDKRVAERADKADAFIQDLVTKAMTVNDTEREAWEALSVKALEISVANLEAFAGLNECTADLARIVRANGDQAGERHTELAQKLAEIGGMLSGLAAKQMSDAQRQ